MLEPIQLIHALGSHVLKSNMAHVLSPTYKFASLWHVPHSVHENHIRVGKVSLRWRIMGTIASQITSLAIVYSIVYSSADQRKHQSFASLAFVRGIHRDRWIPRTKGQLRGKCFHLITSSCWSSLWFVTIRAIADLHLTFTLLPRTKCVFDVVYIYVCSIGYTVYTFAISALDVIVNRSKVC